MEKITKCAFGMMLVSMTFSIQAKAACWQANQDTGSLSFSGVTENRGFDGNFEAFQVEICMEDKDLTSATIVVEVDTASANTNSRDRDQTLQGEEFFWVSQFPKANWTSVAIEPFEGAFSHQAKGQMKLKDVSLDQPVQMSLVERDNGLYLIGQAEMMRLDYNVGVGEFDDTDFIENRVDVSFELQLEPVS